MLCVILKTGMSHAVLLMSRVKRDNSGILLDISALRKYVVTPH